ncbi:MAG: hypothetical protein M3453_17665, partial [Pseudomonadota bacterium]|nr:hypothetical protein [Pseudomonadota bacterium]
HPERPGRRSRGGGSQGSRDRPLSRRLGPESFAEEIADRFVPPPEPVENLIALADLRRKAHRLGVERLDAGPEAIAATFREGANVAAIRKGTPAESKLERRGDRLVLPRRTKRLERAAGWRPSSLMRSPAGTPAGA